MLISNMKKLPVRIRYNLSIFHLEPYLATGDFEDGTEQRK